MRSASERISNPPPRPSNNELQRTRDGNAAASPLNSVFAGRQTGTRNHE
jgi:hypothetical protein